MPCGLMVERLHAGKPHEAWAGSIPATATNDSFEEAKDTFSRKDGIMICRICGHDKEEKHFKSFKLKDGTLSRMKICNTCRSMRYYPRQDKTMKKLEQFSDLDLVRALELRGLKVIVTR